MVTLLKENPNYLNAIVNLANLKNDTYFFDDAIEYYNQADLIIKNILDKKEIIKKITAELKKI